MLEHIELLSSDKPAKASIIWLHGLGADGHDFANFVPELRLSSQLPVRFIFPHAPMRPVTINQGMSTRAWYDIFGLHEGTHEDELGVREAHTQIVELIEQEHLRGIPRERIILGGFSQGGAMAMFTGLRYAYPLAGIIALSTYLPLAAKIAAESSQANQHIPLFLAHGISDPIVPFSWGLSIKNTLEKLHYPVEWHEYPMSHQVCYQEILDMRKWIETRLLFS